MKKTRNLLMTICVAATLLIAAIVCLFETETLIPGLMATESQSEFLFTVLMELLTLASAFLALRMFKFEVVHRQLCETHEFALRKWGVIRLALLFVPMLADTLLYYIYMNPTFGYLAIILLLCLPFVWPSMQRCQSETEK